MKKRKITIICIFSALILATVIYSLVSAIASYNYDMDPANGIDIMAGFGAALTLVLGGFIVICELEVFYTVYYFFVGRKTVAKTWLNILSTVCLLLVFFTDTIANFLYKYVSDVFSEESLVSVALFLTYILLRIICFGVSVSEWEKEYGTKDGTE